MKSPRLKFMLKVVFTLAIIAGVYFVYRSIRNYYYEKQLAEVIARLDAAEPGWQWEDRFARLPKLSKEENAGEEIKAILRLLSLDDLYGGRFANEWGKAFFTIDNSREVQANSDFLKDHPNALLPVLNRDRMSKLIATSPCPEGIQRALQLKRFSAGFFLHKYRPILLMSTMPDIQCVRNLVRLLSWNAALELEANNSELAADDISAMLQVARVFDQDPFRISSLNRSVLMQMSCHAVHRLLAQSILTAPATLQRLQDEFLTEESLMISLAEVFRWERAIYDHDLKLLHSGEYTLSNYLFLIGNMNNTKPVITKWDWLDNILTKIYPAIVLDFWAQPQHFAQERAGQLNFFGKAITWASSPEHQLLDHFKTMQQQGPGVSPFIYMQKRLGSNSGAQDNYLKESFDDIDKYARAMLSYRAHCRCIATALAAERYRLEGSWPTTWEQLSPSYLPTVLLDPFTGKPLFLKQLADGLMIYSVGVNGIDDGGKIFPTDKQYNNDIGYRLWNPDQRRVDMSKELKATEQENKGSSE